MFCIWILVSRASDSAQNLLVSREHGVPERHFETALRQFLQCALPEFIRNKCSACEFWFFELQILTKSCWFLDGMAYLNVTLRVLWDNFFNSIFQNSFAINVLHANFGLSSFRFWPKPVGFLKSWRTQTSLWDYFETISAKHSSKIHSLSFRFWPKPVGFLKATNRLWAEPVAQETKIHMQNIYCETLAQNCLKLTFGYVMLSRKQQVLSRIWSSRENFLSACKTTRKTTWICVLTHKWEVVFS